MIQSSFWWLIYLPKWQKMTKKTTSISIFFTPPKMYKIDEIVSDRY